MADVDISYNGSSIATMSATGTKTLKTAGKVCEDDIEIVYTKPAGGEPIHVTTEGQVTTAELHGETAAGIAPIIYPSYIGSNNSRPYIDTGIIPTINTKVLMSATKVKPAAYFFGCWSRDYNNGAYAVGNDGSEIYAGYDGQGGGVAGNIIGYDTDEHTVVLDKNIVKIDGTVRYTFTPAGSIGNTQYPLYLFCQNRIGYARWRNNSFTEDETFCMISCKIWDSDVLIRDYVPILDINGTPCIWDGVNHGYVYPKQGTFSYTVSA